MKKRTAEVKRTTSETNIVVKLNIDGSGKRKISTGMGFFDHMLDLMGKHALLDLEIQAKGDLHIDYHHTVEDVGIALGQAFAKALGDKEGIRRYGHFLLPMDEVLMLVALDFSGRPHLEYQVTSRQKKIVTFDVQLLEEFLRAFVLHAGLTLHVKMIHGNNAHHIYEAVFKGIGKAIDMALQLDPRVKGVPSTKGVL